MQKFKTQKEINDLVRPEKTMQMELDFTKNKSGHSLQYKTIWPGEYDASKVKVGGMQSTNYSFCDFKGTVLRGCKFKRCNFSFAINMHLAEIDDDTDFIECNFSGVPKAQLPIDEATLKSKKCNTFPRGRDLTDQEIEEFFDRE